MPRPTLVPTDQLLLTPEDAGEVLRLGRSSVYGLLRSGELESLKVGHLRRIPRQALEDYVERLRDAARTGTGTGPAPAA